ncbi:amino acid synthesis family protein [Ramlibacter rhizophilus]|uniref:Amino acid synthesis family protein n=1 Tax=Ramlibacter rhizophilus TaxID=1781167 RepID=A0A4Z0C123_9BURK|nr:amino acid synthesis family protein [Ramlibacter rhizophilus]TFZ04504.1 amino acid synthesis family protein [Ramlibacter rhizophilus]
MEHRIRKSFFCQEIIHHDGGKPAAQPLRLGVAAVVMENPFAGRFESDLMPFMNSLKPLAMDLAQQLLANLGTDKSDIQVFGKGSMVGTDGELEHAAAWHAPGGAGIKEVLGAKGFVSAGKMVAALGSQLQIPLVYVNSPWVRSHYNTTALCIHDAPRPRELVFALAMGTGARIHARLQGVTREQVEAGQGPSF